MIAAGTLRFLDPFGTGKLVLFQVTYDKVSATITLPLFST
jgi:chloride channel 3/4/5